jgi:general secretion pathway protein D
MIKGLTGLALGAGLALVAAGCVERTGAVRPAGPTLAGPAAAPSDRATQRAGRDVGAPAPAAQPAARKPGFYRGTGEFLSGEAFARRVREVPATGDVTLNFADADIREVVRTVLGDLLGLNYLIDPNVSGMVTVQTSSPLARSALLPALESILRVSGAALVKDGALYRVVPWETAAQAAPPLVAGVRGGRVAGFGIQIVPLEFISAVEMEKILEPFAPKGSILKADEARSLLILAGTREERATLLEAVALFDVDWLKGMSFGLFPLEYGSAEELVGELEIVFGEETPLAGLVRVVPVERLNAVLVISQKPQYLEEAQTWIERLDQSVDGEVQRVYVYYV